jgi:peptidoglycan/LPS O-acetylase OafA/YrhL
LITAVTSPQPADLGTNRPRWEFLDIFRAIAALAVLIQHAFESQYNSFQVETSRLFNFGMYGVTLFFLCSGFIIPVSLEASMSIGAFWKRRVTRLYPLYIATILGYLVFCRLRIGSIPLPSPSAESLLIHLTMLTKFTSQPLIFPIYWTLSMETFFYILLSVLFATKIHRFSFELALFALIGTYFICLDRRSGAGLMFYLATMFVGSALLRWFRGEVTSRPIVLLMAGVLLAIGLYGFVVALPHAPVGDGARGRWPAINAWFMAYATFIVGLKIARRPGFLARHSLFHHLA